MTAQTIYYHPIDNVLSRLRNVTEKDSGWSACCPAHGDVSPSLSVTVTDDDVVLMYCHSGCEIHEIVKAIGMEVGDLYPNLPKGDRRYVCRERFANPEVIAESYCQVRRDFSRDMQLHVGFLRPHHVDALASQLGVQREALNDFHLGYWHDKDGPYWAIPEMEPDGRIVGIMRRYLDGSKKALAGGSRGLTGAYNWHSYNGPIVVPEGFSDTVALQACGIPAVGRPSARGGGDLLIDLANRYSREIVIVGENDRKPDGSWPGQTGANTIAAQLSTNMHRTVPVIMPPAEYKDARQLYLEQGSPGVINWLNTKAANFQQPVTQSKSNGESYV